VKVGSSSEYQFDAKMPSTSPKAASLRMPVYQKFRFAESEFLQQRAH